MNTVGYSQFRELRGKGRVFFKSRAIISTTALERLCILFSFLKSFFTLMKILEMTRDPRMLAIGGEERE